MRFKNTTFKAVFLGIVLVILAGNIYSLFFYADLIPLHVDEGGFFFHFTNTLFQNRFEISAVIPRTSLEDLFLSKVGTESVI